MPPDPQPAPNTREWTVRGRIELVPGEDGEPTVYRLPLDREEVREALSDVEAMGHRGGGMFMIAPMRELNEDTGEYETVGWHFKQLSAPAARRRRPEPAPAEAEPVEAEVVEESELEPATA